MSLRVNLLCAVLGAAVSAASASAVAAAGAGATSPASPLSVLAAFEEAWAGGRADLVETILAADRIALALSDAGPRHEAYTKTQAAYLIRDALAYRLTEDFSFVEFRWSEDGSEPPCGVARWRFRRSENGPLRELPVTVKLRQEGSDWVVSEIRFLPSR